MSALVCTHRSAVGHRACACPLDCACRITYNSCPLDRLEPLAEEHADDGERLVVMPPHTLDELIELVRALPPPTAAQRREQAISFAYGNCKLSNDAVTREMVEAAYDKLHPPEPAASKAATPYERGWCTECGSSGHEFCGRG